MNVSIKLLFLFLTMTTVNSQNCSEGCLKCTKDAKCEICDIAFGFVNTGVKCEKTTLENCAIPKSNVECLQCSKGYYVSSSKTCDKIIANIPNCASYLNQVKCERCEGNFYLEENICQPVKTLIDDCVEYEADGKCAKCLERFLSLDQKSCEEATINTDFNCAFRFFPLVCSRCRNGYGFDETLYLNDFDEVNFRYAVIQQNILKPRVNYLNSPVCSSSSTVVKSGDVCDSKLFRPETCNDCGKGKHYDSIKKECIKDPQQIIASRSIIQFCYLISLNQECQRCFEGYFLHFTNKVCLPHTKMVENCQIMSQRKDGECFKCKDEFFLAERNECRLRQLSGTNCDIPNYFEDQCEKCLDGFISSFQNQLCVPPIDNCIDYNTSTTLLRCNKCSSGYYVNTFSCVQVPSANVTDNCEEYDVNMDCSKCEGDRVLLYNQDTDKYQCATEESQIEFKDCALAKYSQSSGYRCDKCDNRASKVRITNRCIVDTAMNDANCSSKDAGGSCIRCKSGFYLNSTDSSCVQSQDANCEIYVSHPGVADPAFPPRCIKCKPNFILFNNVCFDEFSEINNSCLKKDGDDCILCMSNHRYDLIKKEKEVKCRSRAIYTGFDGCDALKKNTEADASSAYSCISCKKGLFLDSTGSCVSCNKNNCKITGAISELTVANDTTCNVEVDGKCIQHSKNPSKYVDPTVIPDPIPSVDPEEHSLVSVTGSYMTRHSFFEDVNSYVAASAFATNHVAYANVFYNSKADYDSNTIKHATCKIGKARNYSVDPLTPANNDCLIFIKNCNVRSNNLLGSPNRIFASCNQCYDGDVVVYTKTALNKTLLAGIDAKLISLNVQTKLPSTFCHPLPVAGVNIANCALMEAFDNGGTLSARCYSCKPGYKPTKDGNGIVTACSAITNCISSEVGDRCERCLKGKSLKHTLDECVTNVAGTVNCKKLNSSGSCAECEDGFAIDITNACKQVKLYDCAEWDHGECMRCRNPEEMAVHYNPEMNTNDISCTSGQRNMPPNCDISDVHGKCVRCNEEYIADYFGKCFHESRISNCVQYDLLNGICFECASGFEYDFMAKRCEPIVNFIGGQNCPADFNYRYVTNGGMDAVCGSKGIEHCIYHDIRKQIDNSIINCLQCKPGYIAENISGAENTCIGFPPVANCKDYRSDDYFNSLCKECEDNFFLDGSNLCRPRQPVPRCEEYFEASSHCKRCAETFYVDGGECVERTNILEECGEYYSNKDECKTLSPNSQYIGVFKELLDDPPSADPGISKTDLPDDPTIEGCLVYFNESTCDECSSDSYPYQNKCLPVVDEIAGCSVYASKEVCKKCVEGQVLIDGECKVATATNCLIFRTEAECATCPEEFPLLNETKSCVKNPAVEFCSIYKSDNACLKCDTGYYITDGLCNQVEKEIEHCKTYSGKEKCEECNAGYYLLGEECNPNPTFDSECETYSLADEECSLCHPGYVLIDNRCAKCGVGYHTCAVCSSEDRGKCLLCRSGYHMKVDGICYENTENKVFDPVTVIDLDEG